MYPLSVTQSIRVNHIANLSISHTQSPPSTGRPTTRSVSSNMWHMESFAKSGGKCIKLSSPVKKSIPPRYAGKRILWWNALWACFVGSSTSDIRRMGRFFGCYLGGLARFISDPLKCSRWAHLYTTSVFLRRSTSPTWFVVRTENMNFYGLIQERRINSKLLTRTCRYFVRQF